MEPWSIPQSRAEGIRATVGPNGELWTAYSSDGRAPDVGIGERLQFASTNDGHAPNGRDIDPAWKTFFQRWLKDTPVEFSGWTGKYGPANGWRPPDKFVVFRKVA